MPAFPGDTAHRMPGRQQAQPGGDRVSAPPQRHGCLHHPFELHAARTPAAIAAADETGSLSYGELNRRANQLAHYLRDLGVKPEVPVAVCMEPGLDMIAAFLAVLKAGGAFVFLDPACPPERFRFLLDDSAAVAVLTRGHPVPVSGETSATVPVLDLAASNPPWSNHSDLNPDTEAIGLKPAHLAQILYTSGSTGEPKGVLIEHCGMSVLSNWFVREFKLTSDFVSLVATPASFMQVYKNIYGPLSVGARLQIVRDQKDPGAILSAITRANVTLLNLTPSTFSMLVDADQSNVLSRIRTVVFSGEPVPLRKFTALAHPWPAMVNTYGQAECPVSAAYRIPRRHGQSTPPPVPIGQALPHARIYILNRAGEPAPDGVAGELYVSSSTLARGYLNRPAMTAERFLPDRFASRPGARMFRTGDLGRRLPDGAIEFLGRNDFQVKIRGARVELGEIEAQLRQCGAVRDAVVTAREDAPGDWRLVAYYLALPGTAAEEESLRPAQLRAHLAARLPEHMVPAAYVRLESFPLTASGKLNRRELKPPTASAHASQGYEPPQGAMETMMGPIWAEVLKLDRIGRHDNFFSLGGNSLLAMQVELRLRKLLGVEIPVSRIFQSPTIAGLARAVEEMLDSMRSGNELLGILEELESMPESNAETTG